MPIPLRRPTTVLLALNVTLQDGVCQGSFRSHQMSKPSEPALLLLSNVFVLILKSNHNVTMLTKCICFPGKLEERNPFVSFRFPPSFEKKYPTAVQNLRTNAHRLTSPFDIHATFLDILNYTGALHGNVSHVCIVVRLDK